MRIGALRRRVTLQRESLAPDGEGGNTAYWVTVADMWAEIVPSVGNPAAANSGRRVTHTIRMRANSGADVKTGMRFLDGGRIFFIRAVSDADGRGRWLDVQVEEGGVLG